MGYYKQEVKQFALEHWGNLAGLSQDKQLAIVEEPRQHPAKLDKKNDTEDELAQKGLPLAVIADFVSNTFQAALEIQITDIMVEMGTTQSTTQYFWR